MHRIAFRTFGERLKMASNYSGGDSEHRTEIRCINARASCSFV